MALTLASSHQRPRVPGSFTEMPNFQMVGETLIFIGCAQIGVCTHAFPCNSHDNVTRGWWVSPLYLDSVGEGRSQSRTVRKWGSWDSTVASSFQPRVPPTFPQRASGLNISSDFMLN